MEEWLILGFYLGLGFGVGYGLVRGVASGLWALAVYLWLRQ